MKSVYIFGHQNPDTDTVTSAIALKHLKKSLGIPAEAYVLGNINLETKYVLDYFNIPTPKYLNDVKLQIKDINYHKDFYINKSESVEATYNYMNLKGTTGIPIVDDSKHLIGIVTAKTLLRNIFENNNNALFTSYNNILKTLNGEEILKFDDEIKGNIIAASYKSTTFLESISLDEDDILIVGNRHSIIERAIMNKIKLLIITENEEIKEEHLNLAKINKVNIIRTGLTSFLTIKKIYSSNYIGNILLDDRAYTVMDNDYYDDFIVDANKMKFNNYPVVDKKNVCKGLIRLTEISKKNRKKVILVDHNEYEQSAIGIDEAEILEVIDHHNIGSISTANPINFRNMAVGSTNTIIYYLYKESRIDIPKNIAGIMLSGIISDTLNFTSPTTTDKDIFVAKNLEIISNVNSGALAREMFKAATALSTSSKRDIINKDIKSYQYDDSTYSVSQILTMNYLDILNEKNEYINELELIKKENKDEFVLLIVTDIVNSASYILYTSGTENLLEEAFVIDEVYQGYCMKKFVSRKKQFIPAIMEVLSEN